MIGLQGNSEGPLKDKGCKCKVRPVRRVVSFFPGMHSCPGAGSLLGESCIKTRVVVVVSPEKYDRRLSSYLSVIDFPGQRKYSE